MEDSGLCLKYTRQCFDVASYYGTAIDAWTNNPDQRTDRNPPPAVPVWFWSSSPYRHVAFWDGSAVVSTYNDDVRVFASLAAAEGVYGGYLGWSPQINRVTIYTPPEVDELTPDEVKGACEEAVKGVLRAPEFQGYMRDLPWAHPINGPDAAELWLRDARFAPEVRADVAGVSAQVDELGAAGTLRSWPSTLALILAVSVIAGLLAGLISQVVEQGAIAGAATLLGGLVGWAATTVGQRARTARAERGAHLE
jgi:hypothetical protein